MVLLRGTGGQHRYLPDRRRIGEPVVLAPGFELEAASGERVDLRTGEPFDVGHPVGYRLPPNPQPFRQLLAENRLVEVPGGQLKPIQQPPIHRPPHPIGPLDLVGDHHMGMELGVVGAGSELGERRRHIPRSGDRPGHHPKPRRPVLIEHGMAVVVEHGSSGGAPGRRCYRLQISQRLGGCCFERRQHLLTGVGISEGPEQGH